MLVSIEPKHTHTHLLTYVLQTDEKYKWKCKIAANITLRLFHARCDRAQKVVRCHIDRGRFAVYQLDGGKVSKHFVRRSERAQPVLILDDLWFVHGGSSWANTANSTQQKAFLHQGRWWWSWRAIERKSMCRLTFTGGPVGRKWTTTRWVIVSKACAWLCVCVCNSGSKKQNWVAVSTSTGKSKHGFKGVRTIGCDK